MRNFFRYWRINRFLPLELLRSVFLISHLPFNRGYRLLQRYDDRENQATVKTGSASAAG